MDYLKGLKSIPQQINVAIYGAGKQGKIIQKILGKYRQDITFSGFIDDYASGDEIASLDEFLNQKKNDTTVLIPAGVSETMKKHLDECGFRNYLVLHPAIDYCHKYFNYEDEYQDLKPIFDKIYAGLHHDDRDVFNQLIDGRTVGLDNMDSKVGVPVYDFYPNIKPVYLDFINENVIETAILAGVFNGDSALLLINGLPELKMLYGFEPHKKNYDESPLKDEIEATGKVTIIGKGLWDKNATLWLTGESSSSQVVLEKSQGAVEVELVKIDDFMLSVKNKLDYLVLDVEGAELNVLKGAINTLKKDRPQLAISAYHSRFDMFEIPLFLMENLERYVFRLGHYTKHYGETVFYAIPEECFDKGDVI